MHENPKIEYNQTTIIQCASLFSQWILIGLECISFTHIRSSSNFRSENRFVLMSKHASNEVNCNEKHDNARRE